MLLQKLRAMLQVWEAVTRVLLFGESKTIIISIDCLVQVSTDV